ncbi:MAG: hypothetical protein ABSG53_19860 [Thermoguttaceae bacterium]|jgi:hypothetical protein
MCYDMCLRALDDALQTFGSMHYRRVGDEHAGAVAKAEVAALVEQLRQLRQRLGHYEGAHLDETVKCNACNVYHHHNHQKTEWRGEASRGGYDDETKWATRKDGSRYVMRPPSPYADT